MGRFNLIDSPWISVIYSESGANELVSLKTLFQDAGLIESLAGDTKTQEFAVLRVLLAILITVYSRFDADGNPYDCLEIDESFRQMSNVDEDEQISYLDALSETWDILWERGKFSSIVSGYLDKWYDRFYLFDDRYPFFQVLARDIGEDRINKKKPSTIKGKSFNRTLSESNNKVALFSPKYDAGLNKEILVEDEVARWLITYQGYTGLADKVMFGIEKYKASKGWLFDIGGVHIGGRNFFETLMLNCILIHPVGEYEANRQRPCWESSSEYLINEYFTNNIPDNLAQLYTTWSRAIYIDPELNIDGGFACQIVKLPDLEHKDQFLEPMTLWRFNLQGDNKNTFTPRKHRSMESLWRSFGLLAMPSSDANDGKQRRPGVVAWIDEKKKNVGDLEISIIATSMEDDGNATSWVPVDEIYDALNINDFVLTDVKANHWVPRLENIVAKTKTVVDRTYKRFLLDIAEIRNIKENTRLGFMNREIEALYFEIDEPFKSWIASIEPTDSKDEKIIKWREELYDLVRKQADTLFNNASSRDLKGIQKEDQVLNIATAYNKFIYFLNQEIRS